MPAGKSRRRKVKYSAPPKKRKKERPVQPTMQARQSAIVQTPEPVSSSEVSAPATSTPAPSAPAAMPRPEPVRHTSIITELRTIGILAGIMLIVLIILAVVLS